MRITRLKSAFISILIILTCFGIVEATFYPQITIHVTGNLPQTCFLSQQQTIQDNQTILTYTLTNVVNLSAWQINIYSPDQPLFDHAVFYQNPFPPALTVAKQLDDSDTQLASAYLNNALATGTAVLAIAVFNTSSATFYIKLGGTTLFDMNEQAMPYGTDPATTTP